MPDALSRLSELSDDELNALIDIAQARAEGALTRRDLLKMGGGLAAAGVLGGSAVGSAAADASTSDSDWNLGEPGNRGDVFADGVDATSVNPNEIYTVKDETLSALADAVSTYDRVQLRQGATYSGSQTIALDETNREVFIDARGATIDGEGIVLDVTGHPGRLEVLGGTWQSDGTSGSRCIRLTDTRGNKIAPRQVKNAEAGIEARNVDSYCEGNTIECEFSSGADNVLLLRGATATGGTGTDSFRKSDISIDGRVNTGGTVYKEVSANTYASDIRVSAFVDGSRTAMQLDGSVDGTIYRPTIESTDGPDSETGIAEGPNGVFGKGMILHPDIRGVATPYDFGGGTIGVLEVGDGGSLTYTNPAGQSGQQVQFWHFGAGYMDLRSSPPGSGNFYLDDGTNTSSGDPGMAVKGPGGTWFYMN